MRSNIIILILGLFIIRINSACQPTTLVAHNGVDLTKNRLSQRQLIKRNFELRLNNFAIIELPGHPLFLDAWAQAVTPDSRVLLLNYFISGVIDAIGLGARQAQIYPLLIQLRDFITDNQAEIPVLYRTQLEMQIRSLENMRWTNA